MAVDELVRYSFRSWLLSQVDRQDDVGRTARWLASDPGDDAGEAGGPLALVDRVQRAAPELQDVALMAGAVAGIEEWGRFITGQSG